MDDEVLTLEEAAALLKVSETLVYQLARSGSLPGRKVGREWRFLRSALLEWLRAPAKEDGVKEGVVQLDKFGGEYKVENGREHVAMWLPLSLEEKERLLEKMQALREGRNLSAMVADYLREWLEK